MAWARLSGRPAGREINPWQLNLLARRRECANYLFGERLQLDVFALLFLVRHDALAHLQLSSLLIVSCLVLLGALVFSLLGFSLAHRGLLGLWSIGHYALLLGFLNILNAALEIEAKLHIDEDQLQIFVFTHTLNVEKGKTMTRRNKNSFFFGFWKQILWHSWHRSNQQW